MRVPKEIKCDNSNKFITMALKKPITVDKSWVLLSDKDKIKFIKMVETICRSSIEYKQYIQYLKDEVDMTQCSFFQNINKKNGAKVSIEIHHEPFTLFDIVQIVTEKHIKEDIQINPLNVAEEVMKLHYRNLVGLIPLSVTVHELVHDGKIFIPLQYLYGDYTKFIHEY